MLLIISYPNDYHVEAVVKYFTTAFASIHYLFWPHFPTQSRIAFQLFRHHNPNGYITFTNGDSFHLDEINVVWNRLIAQPQALQTLSTDLRNHINTEATSFMVTLDAYCPQASWLDPPNAVLITNQKPRQLAVAKTLGLSIPDTVMGNNADALESICSQHETLIIKSVVSKEYVSQPNFQERLQFHLKQCFFRDPNSNPDEMRGPLLKTQVTPPQRVSAKQLQAKYSQLSLCPVIIQAYVPKAYELRITVVGQKVFACRIDSPQAHTPEAQVDWRLDIDNIPHSAHSLPDAIAQKCLDLCRALGLQYGAIDMIVTPEGEHVFLEINPQGQWLWVQQRTGLPIAEAIADWLMHPPAGN